MKWSIIIPIYQVKAYLGTCLECIRQQMDDETEVWLVDDASTDGSGDICDTWSRSDERFKYLRHPQNRGLSVARNTGLTHAGGQWILFVDADDWLAPGTLSALRQLAQQDEADVVEFPIHLEHGTPQARWFVPGHGECVGFNDWVAAGAFRYSYAWNKMYRAELWQSVRFEEGRLFEDMFTIPYVMEQARCILRTDQGGYYYCSHQGSLSNTLSRKGTTDLLEATLKLYEHLCQRADVTDDVLDDLYMEVCNRQIMCLKMGGPMLLPMRHVAAHHVWQPGQSAVRRLKWLLMRTGRPQWCKWWARFMPLSSH